MWTCIRLAIPVFTALTFCGCNDETLRYPVSGKVLIDGKPVAMGTIRFVPESGRPVSSAIKTDGSFALAENSLSSSRMTDGVKPGFYRVSITATKIIDEDSDQVEWLVPSQYADFRTSGIQLEIEGAQDDLVVDLRSETEVSDETIAKEQNTGDDQSEPIAADQQVPKE